MGHLPGKQSLRDTPITLPLKGKVQPVVQSDLLPAVHSPIQVIKSNQFGFNISLDDFNPAEFSGIQFPELLEMQIRAALAEMTQLTGKVYGADRDALLLTLSSSPSVSASEHPDEVPFIGLGDKTLPGICALLDDPRPVYEAYCRLIMAYARVVIGTSYCRSKSTSKNMHDRMENRLHQLKGRKGFSHNHELSASDWANMAGTFKAMIQVSCGTTFPEEPWTQLLSILRAKAQHIFAESGSGGVKQTPVRLPELTFVVTTIEGSL